MGCKRQVIRHKRHSYPVLRCPSFGSRPKLWLLTFPGLQIYETGLVKEGVGAGGASIAAMAKLNGAVTADLLLKEIERNYALLMGLK